MSDPTRPEEPWRPMSEAPTLGWPIQHVEILGLGGKVFPDAHFAQDLSGEEQPPFSGWYEPVLLSDGTVSYYREIERPQGWRLQPPKTPCASS